MKNVPVYRGLTQCKVNNIIPIRLNLTESNSLNSNEFFWYLFNQTINSLFQLNLLNGKGGPIDVSILRVLNSTGIGEEADWIFRTPILRKNYLNNRNLSFEFDQLVDDLRLLRNQVKEEDHIIYNQNTKFLYLVDEAQNIYNNTKIIEDIRFIIQSEDLGIGFVFAGDSTYEISKWEKVFGGSYRDFEVIQLTNFKDVDAVKQYFSKSLYSVEWTKNEIEETLFYRFNVACRQIFLLTSGKPSWINTIATKMFERCIKKETKELRFDKQAQADVKKLLQDSGQLDKVKIQIIETLEKKYQFWISDIFACEGNSLNQVYFFCKLKYSGDNYINREEFRNFCILLQEKEVIKIINEKAPQSSIYLTNTTEKDFLDLTYVVFGSDEDTIKQWLQINSDGKYSFHSAPPQLRYISYVNDELTTDKNSSSVTFSSHSFSTENIIIPDIISQINTNTLEINDYSYSVVKLLYNACKRFEKSKDNDLLYVSLIDLNSEKMVDWNVYNYNDKEHIIPFYESSYRIDKLVKNLDFSKSSASPIKLIIKIMKVERPNLGKLQNLILKSKDLKKLNILLEHKMNDLIEEYVTKSNVEQSDEISNFFFNLFENGFDLRLIDLNNSGYVFLVRNLVEKSSLLLLEAKNKIEIGAIEENDNITADLVFYNLAILEVKKEKFTVALDQFMRLKDHYMSDDVKSWVGALQLIKIDAENNIQLEEIKEGNADQKYIDYKLFTDHNIEVLNQFLRNNKTVE